MPKEVRGSGVSAPDEPLLVKGCPINFSYAPHYGPVHGYCVANVLLMCCSCVANVLIMC